MKRVQLLYYHKKIYTIFSLVYTVLYFYRVLHETFMFTPIINPITNQIEECEEVYFTNNLGGYVYRPKEEDGVLYQKLMFYYNDFEGNSSSRFKIIRKIQTLFPTFTILQLDYPGFGISSTCVLTMKDIIEKTTEVIYGILEDNDVTEYGFWGETMGNYVVSQILYQSDLNPKFIVQYNPVVNVLEKYVTINTIFSFPFLFPCLFYKKSTELLNTFLQNKDCHVIVFFNQCKNQEKYTMEMYYGLTNVSWEKKSVVELEGNSVLSFLIPKNEKKIQKQLSNLS